MANQRIKASQSWDGLGTSDLRDGNSLAEAVIDQSTPDEDMLLMMIEPESMPLTDVLAAIDAARVIPRWLCEGNKRPKPFSATPIAACLDDEELALISLEQRRAAEDKVEETFVVGAMNGIQSRSASGNGLRRTIVITTLQSIWELREPTTRERKRRQRMMESRSSERRTFLKLRAEQRDFAESTRQQLLQLPPKRALTLAAEATVN